VKIAEIKNIITDPTLFMRKGPMRVKATYYILLLMVVLLGACAGAHHGTQTTFGSESPEIRREAQGDREKIDALEIDLAALNGRTNLAESRQVAEAAVTYSNHLAAEYRLVRPAVFHNVLVRMGLKNRGLCYHWTEDLLQRLQLLKLKNYQLYWGVAHRGSELREHNSVVITAKGQNFDQGMVLDPWRNSGELYWTRVKSDRYPWKERFPNE
jgi:hypothetical protein